MNRAGREIRLGGVTGHWKGGVFFSFFFAFLWPCFSGVMGSFRGSRRGMPRQPLRSSDLVRNVAVLYFSLLINPPVPGLTVWLKLSTHVCTQSWEKYSLEGNGLKERFRGYLFVCVCVWSVVLRVRGGCMYLNVSSPVHSEATRAGFPGWRERKLGGISEQTGCSKERLFASEWRWEKAGDNEETESWGLTK